MGRALGRPPGTTGRWVDLPRELEKRAIHILPKCFLVYHNESVLQWLIEDSGGRHLLCVNIIPLRCHCKTEPELICQPRMQSELSLYELM